ncbi:MAG TPA: hypothetical protein VKE74_13940 [Gemmataceae bacterium]|nr:hypothetical protein [Gemmataceae bacterium]
MRRWFSTTAAAMAVCLLGAATVLLPWAGGQVLRLREPPGPDGKAVATVVVPFVVRGYELWHGCAVAAVLVGVFLFLVATGPVAPPPAWRSLAVGLGGAVAIVLALAGQSYSYAALRSDDPLHLVDAGWRLGSYAPVGAGLGLLLVAAVEFRARVARWAAGRPAAAGGEGGRAEPDAAADGDRDPGS